MLTEQWFFPPEEESPEDKKNVRIFLVTSVEALEHRKKNCKVYILEPFAVYGKISIFVGNCVNWMALQAACYQLGIGKEHRHIYRN